MSELKNGYYDGKILDYGIKTTAAGDPAPTILFQIQTPGGGNERVFWQGSFKSEVAIDIALKALLVCGLERGEDLPKLAEGAQSGLLDTDKTLSLKVELESDQKDPSKKWPRVRGIYSPKSNTVKDAIDSSRAEDLMAGLNLAASFELLKASMPKAQEAIPEVGF